MNTQAFRTHALTLLPDVRMEEVLENRTISYEDFENGWHRLIVHWINPAMVEVHIYYTKPFELKKDRRKSIGVWCYKFAGKDWDINKTYRFWG